MKIEFNNPDPDTKLTIGPGGTLVIVAGDRQITFSNCAMEIESAVPPQHFRKAEPKDDGNVIEIPLIPPNMDSSRVSKPVRPNKSQAQKMIEEFEADRQRLAKDLKAAMRKRQNKTGESLDDISRRVDLPRSSRHRLENALVSSVNDRVMGALKKLGVQVPSDSLLLMHHHKPYRHMVFEKAGV
jgi:hypothetical protein